MANNPLPYDGAAEAAVNAFCAAANSGSLAIYAGTQPALNGSAGGGTLLASLVLSATAFSSATAASGTVTAAAGSISSATASATGTAAFFVIFASNGTTIVGTGTVGTSGCDLNLNTTTINSGATVSVSSFSVTMAET